MNFSIKNAISQVYEPLKLSLTKFTIEAESQDYDACRFHLGSKIIIFRKAKITPKKVGQFVTFWKRAKTGVICPFEESDHFDFFVIAASKDNFSGQFVFPKKRLLEKGIISTEKKEGKRGFRVYPPWDVTKSKQAITTQKWQKKYFFHIHDTLDENRLRMLYN